MVFDIGYLAGVVAAVATIGAPIVAILGKIMQLLRQIEQAQNDIRLSKSENEILMKGTLACLKGLKEQGCNGPVSDAINEIEEFMLKKAHS